jgi:hypothetical protein
VEDYIGPDGFIALAALDDGSVLPGAAMKNAARLLEERTYALVLTLIAWES